jgi:hypothetical protein
MGVESGYNRCVDQYKCCACCSNVVLPIKSSERDVFFNDIPEEMIVPVENMEVFSYYVELANTKGEPRLIVCRLNEAGTSMVYIIGMCPNNSEGNCSIYNERPGNCAKVEIDGEGCSRARSRFGLVPISEVETLGVKLE